MHFVRLSAGMSFIRAYFDIIWFIQWVFSPTLLSALQHDYSSIMFAILFTSMHHTTWWHDRGRFCWHACAVDCGVGRTRWRRMWWNKHDLGCLSTNRATPNIFSSFPALSTTFCLLADWTRVLWRRHVHVRTDRELNKFSSVWSWSQSMNWSKKLFHNHVKHTTDS